MELVQACSQCKAAAPCSSMQDNSSEAVVTAAQHPGFSTDPQVLCAAGRTCKGWKAAVQQAAQQCGARHMIAKFKLQAPTPRLASFSSWLQKHATLVRSISGNFQAPFFDFQLSPADKEKMTLLAAAAWQQLQEVLQAASSPAASGIAAAAAATAAVSTNEVHVATAAHQGRQQQQLLQLSSFSSNLLLNADLLNALPAHSLTHLDLEVPQGIQVTINGPALSSALSRLTNLKHLRLCCCGWPNNRLPSSCLDGIAQLGRLTTLQLQGRWEGQGRYEGVSIPEALQAALQQLLAHQTQLQQLQMQFNDCMPVLAMAGLTQLTQLTIGPTTYDAADAELADMPEFSVLPPQLQELRMFTLEASNLEGLLALRKLTWLCLGVAISNPQPLLHLAQLPALQQLELEYYDPEQAAATASAWKLLPQLRELRFGCLADLPSKQQMAVMKAAAEACTGLTTLELGDVESDSDDDDYHDSEYSSDFSGASEPW